MLASETRQVTGGFPMRRVVTFRVQALNQTLGSMTMQSLTPVAVLGR